MNYNNVACLTIISKNYLSAARVLSDSFLACHPGATFYVVLADALDAEFDPNEEKFELLNLYDIGVPSEDIFPFQYSILELNTAIKPFALNYLLLNYKIEKLTYIDPDVLIFRPLEEVWSALDSSSICIIPHMRAPFDDSLCPSEIKILQSGTYNLGFIGLKNDATVFEFLEWWCEKLHLDCVVDINEGLFVDQKWIDLVPAYFPDTFILRDASYNVAYWNLHERSVGLSNGQYFVDEKPLTFFHFSGYDPRNSEVLSKHQTRHELKDNQILRKLFALYSLKLLNADYVNCAKFEYAFSELDNGIKITRPISLIIRYCLKHKISFPSPGKNPDEFCQFLMTPTSSLFGVNLPPIMHGLLLHRSDVMQSFPGAWGGDTSGFMTWLRNTGHKEENLTLLLDNFSAFLDTVNPVKSSYEIYEKRKDLKKAFPTLPFSKSNFEAFLEWMELYGKHEEKISDQMIERVSNSRNGFFKALIFYYFSPEVQKEFPDIHTKPEQYFNWLLSNLKDLPHIDEDEVYTFYNMARNAGDGFDWLQLNNNRALRELARYPLSLFNYSKFKKIARKSFNLGHGNLIGKYFAKASNPLRELEYFYADSEELQQKFPNAFNDKLQLHALVNHSTNVKNFLLRLKYPEWLRKLKIQLAEYEPDMLGINVAGYFDASTGMGQSSRSMLETIKAAGLSYSLRHLPNFYLNPNVNYLKKEIVNYFGNASTNNRINLNIANADETSNTLKYFPKADSFGRKNIGYWVWETEELPSKFKKAADELDEIWTPSEFSAKAIRKCVDVPVHIIPHVINFDEIDAVLAKKSQEREKYGLPEKGLLFGYFFDQKSILERKNPQGVIDAFRKAFSDSPQNEAYLVLKTNKSRPGQLNYELLKSRNKDVNIIWIEQTMSREDTLSLMNCLDVYVSLHRSEGFGLTLAEAMALGKPVIASDYSGNLDFMNEECSLLVKTLPIKTKRAYGPYPRMTIWGNPDITNAAEVMKKMRNPDLREMVGHKAAKQIRSVLSTDRICQTIVEILTYK